MERGDVTLSNLLGPSRTRHNGESPVSHNGKKSVSSRHTGEKNFICTCEKALFIPSQEISYSMSF